MKEFTLFLIALMGLLKGYSQSEATGPELPGNIFLNNYTLVDEDLVLPAALRVPNIDSFNSNPYALIGGGSKGIGYAIAEALAKRNFNLILIARHKDSLIAAKNKLESKYGVHVETIQFDLSKKEAATEIAAWCTDNNIPLKVLCNVAGFGGSKDYLSLPLDTLRYMVDLNVESCMALSLTLLPLLEKNAPAYILNVASMAGFAPIPIKNMYSATKSAVIFFSYGLRYQLKEKNISVSVLCPGPVYTKPEIKAETKKQLGWFGDQMAVSPEKVGEIAVRKTLHKKMVIIPGGLNKIVAFVIRVLPRRWITALYYKVGG
ncbi:MAG TPA: SDR family NAD(P)-dependent oxidoreductase [Chitinophagaceae bacterium]|nr:SDR family NAD(P)-dependent oxidoreductase [Chitinophagaceae bacterium]